MNCTIPVLTIDAQDCVGDSLGKHNYNALSLDTSICNLSSLIYGGDVNVSSIFNNLSSLVLSYQVLERIYNENKLYHILTSSTTVNLLSSFWGNYTFSVQYPINSISLSNENLTVIAPALSTVNVQGVENIIESRLKSLASIYLQENYSPNNFPDNTIVNVTFPLYNLVPTLNDSNNNINDTITVTHTTNDTGAITNTFNYNDRLLYSSFNRDNVHLTACIGLKYYVQNNKWNYNGYIINDTIQNTEILTQTTISTTSTNIVPAIVPTSQTNASQSNTTVCNPLINNKYYPVSKYTSSRCLSTGTQKKPAKATLTFIGTDKKTLVCDYKASGYNAAANSGGTDIWVEFDTITTTIKVYEQNPGPKTLVQTVVYPWSDKIGVNFKYSNPSGSATTFSCCGVQKIGV